ncbi:MAG: P-loop NTPase [Candidatus Margulisiibacteriota bacterium]
MKQITVISGKGGTGKTTIAAAFASLTKSKVMADCDVDAADLYLILTPEVKEKHEFSAAKIALVDKEKCIECRKCIEVCRFSAVSDNFVVDPVSCEGCGVCYRICPTEAIKFEEKISGYHFVSDTRFGPMAHARLEIASENSGKLVTLVRKKAREIAKNNKLDYILIDGPPGIGCPVIASLTGVNLALVVSEPTLSGIHDLERVIDLTEHFKIKTLVCINKYDINRENVRRIEEICVKKSIKVAGKIPYDTEVNRAMRMEKTIIEYDPQSEIAQEITRIWNMIENEV